MFDGGAEHGGRKTELTNAIYCYEMSCFFSLIYFYLTI